jgi:hypothetical protein
MCIVIATMALKDSLWPKTNQNRIRDAKIKEPCNKIALKKKSVLLGDLCYLLAAWSVDQYL